MNNQPMAMLLYLIAAIFFILALRGLSSPNTARSGNMFGMIGMGLAVITTLWVGQNLIPILIAIPIILGAGIGVLAAKKVQMTKMPELVALMHSFVGLAAVLIALAAVLNSSESHSTVQRFELFIGAFIGAITFSASVVAFGKLSGKFGASAITFKFQHWINLILAILMVIWGVVFFQTESITAFMLMAAIALILGVTLIIPIGGADMPVVVSMLNSYSGWAAAGIGFTLNNSVLIIAGACVGSSGAILSYIMCKAMNRSIISVMLGGFGSETIADSGDGAEKAYKSGSVDDVSYLMSNAESVIIVPGYGLAVARAQHALQELTSKLIERGISVKYAIHPVAGRMPGHMNVLLAEANVPYDEVFELEEINNDFANADVAFVIGANDVTNPVAKTDPQSPIYGMPVLDVEKCKSVLFVKRSLSPGYAGIDNELFYKDNTLMLFADAKKMTEDITKNL